VLSPLGGHQVAEAGRGQVCEHDEVTGQPGRDAAERAGSARQRVEELEERRLQLETGSAPTADDVRRAERAAHLERERNLEAHGRAARAHTRAAEGHRQASELLDAAGHHTEAAEHRRKAQKDDDAARSDDAAAHLDPLH
jgi:hypothetical protein